MRRSPAEVAQILRAQCFECGAYAGQPCKALRNGRSHKKGQPMAGFHVKRVFAAPSTKANDR